MENPTVTRICANITDLVLDIVISYIHNAEDRAAISVVCKQWFKIDSTTRKHLKIGMCYSTTPQRVLTRFPALESIKLKGKPRVDLFDLIPSNWGGSATPWVDQLHDMHSLKAWYFKRMVVSDDDLLKLSGQSIFSLKLDQCSGFSTDGLRHICQNCKNLRVLSMENSTIYEKDGKWLNDLASNNKVLETLNFYHTNLYKNITDSGAVEINISDLELLAKNCPNLVSLKITDFRIKKLIQNFFRYAYSLEEFGGCPCFDEDSEADEDAEIDEEAITVSLPANLSRLSLAYLFNQEFVSPNAAKLIKLDLRFAKLKTAAYCTLIQRCPNLEILESSTTIGNAGLATLAQYCTKLKKLRIERGGDDDGDDDDDIDVDDDEPNNEYTVTHAGLSQLSSRCQELEYLAVYASNITKDLLTEIGNGLKKLCDFRLNLTSQENKNEFPLDDGVRNLLTGCTELRKFALYLEVDGGLTDDGLYYIGQNSPNLRWLLLGNAGSSNAGLLRLCQGCPRLQKLEIRYCSSFSENALADAALSLFNVNAETRLQYFKYLWVQGYHEASPTGRHLFAIDRANLNIEVIPSETVEDIEYETQLLMYRSLAGPRTDLPNDVLTPDLPIMRVGYRSFFMTRILGSSTYF